MISHEPAGYACPFCVFLAGGDNGVNAESDLVSCAAGAAALIAPRWWPGNPGHVLVVPAGHHENLYGLPAAAGHAVHDLTREIAIAVRQSYGCEGVSIRQNNEPSGNQTVWHYRVHVFPRFPGDDLYATGAGQRSATVEERLRYAGLLKSYLSAV